MDEGQQLLMPSPRTDRYIDANVREIYIVLVLVTIVARRCTAPRPSCPSGSAQGFSASFNMRVRHCYALYRPTSTSTQTINKYDAHLILEIPNHKNISYMKFNLKNCSPSGRRHFSIVGRLRI